MACLGTSESGLSKSKQVAQLVPLCCVQLDATYCTGVGTAYAGERLLLQYLPPNSSSGEPTRQIIRTAPCLCLCPCPRQPPLTPPLFLSKRGDWCRHVATARERLRRDGFSTALWQFRREISAIRLPCDVINRGTHFFKLFFFFLMSFPKLN